MNEDSTRIEQVNHPLAEPVVQQVIDLWQRENAIITDKEERLREITHLAWIGDKLAGVASAGLFEHESLKQPLYMIRALVDSSFRLQGIAFKLHATLVELLEERFDSGEDISAIGAFVEVEAAHVPDMTEIPCSFSHRHSQQDRPVQFNLTHITESGYPQYVYYFKRASLFQRGPVEDEDIDKLSLIPDSEIRYCWQQLSAHEQQEIVGLWLSYGVIKDRETALQRLPQVAAIALEEGRIVAVASIFRAPYEGIKASLIGFRSFASPDARGSFYATKLLKRVWEEFNQSYREDPQLKDMHGIAYVLQNDKLNKNVARARGPDVGSSLAGYMNDMQLRIRYFDGAQIKVSKAG